MSDTSAPGIALRDEPGRPGLPAGSPDVHISVVICAYTADRWAVMREACRAVQDQLAHADELIVVIDHNEELLHRATSHVDGARVVPNSQTRGLSGARNSGVAASAQGVVVFLDDDAVPRAGWLESIRSLFAEDAVAVVGTRVIPKWQGSRAPSWFPEEFGWVVGCGYRGQPTSRAAIRNPIGASMAIRRTALLSAGGFTSEVGRVGALPVGCEETEFCIRLSEQHPELAVIFTPDAAVDHFVPVERQTLRYFLRRCFHEGRSKRAVARLRGKAQALSAEKHYVKVTLPAALARGISPRSILREPASPARACAVLAGLTATVWGYVTAGSTYGSSAR
ncbi:glycosyltransferase family 2 protein [Winogradskya humida]|uniref:Glycosyl transferase family 2 n=1 Tax=Winogradskya humida TaxID=113566 RepID=A0ABQ3ZEK2_9ACTN|nr:glycosyltransferase family 2 protein [Actinoplanes humidus]GIE17011.1 glycosyl transferase family 2 [Actinoplanes humidus]